MSEQRIVGTERTVETESGETLLEWAAAGVQRSARWLRRPENAVAFAIVLLGFVLRFWDLGTRAYHHDESLHAYYSWFLAEHNVFQHNPLMHGTFQFVGTSFVFRLLGASDATARFLPALAGIFIVVTPLLLFRPQLGRWGAAFASLLLAVSPGMLYFSRFARNDIYIVLWTLLFVWCLWRFLEQPRNRYLYVAAAVSALSFATKEVIYLLLLVFMAYLVAQLLPTVRTLLRTPLRAWPPAATFLLVIVSIVLPLGAAGVGLFQDGLGLNLTNPDPGARLDADAVGYFPGPIGAPISQGPGFASAVFDAIGSVANIQLVSASAIQDSEAGVLTLGGLTFQALDVATLMTAGLFLGGAVVGFLWDWRRWLIVAGVFWGLFALVFTTYFTNWLGLASGLWQSLGYWIAQQDVARGGQPWYYYFVILGTYEFLPLIAGAVSGAYLLWKRDPFGTFLAFWFLMAFLFFTYAGEKMPWLSIHLTLPLILLAARGVGLLAETTSRSMGMALPRPSRAAVLRWGVLALTGLLLVVTAQAAVRASFTNGDVPVEMLVYTQTSPSIAGTVREIERLADASGAGTDLPVTIDTMDGFGWPWYWYLRDYSQIEYRCLGDPGSCGAAARPISPDAPPRGRVLVLNAANEAVAQPHLPGFGPGVRIPFRQWFPEASYRGPQYDVGLSVGEILRGALDLSTWSTIWTYWTAREPPLPLGRIDVIVYFPADYTPDLLAPTGGPA